MEFDYFRVFSHPFHDLGRRVVFCVVRDKVYLLASVATGKLLEKLKIGLGVEGLDEAKMEFRILVDLHCTHHFYAFAIGKGFDLRANPSSCPMAKYRSRLPENRFILVQDHSVLHADFF